MGIMSATKRQFHIFALLVMLTTVFGGRTMACDHIAHATAVSADCIADGVARKDALREVKDNRHDGEAVMDNFSHAVRTATARPTRVIPAGIPAPAAAAVRPVGFSASDNSFYRSSVHDKCSSPIRSHAPVVYFVYGLRHLLC